MNDSEVWELVTVQPSYDQLQLSEHNATTSNCHNNTQCLNLFSLEAVQGIYNGQEKVNIDKSLGFTELKKLLSWKF